MSRTTLLAAVAAAALVVASAGLGGARADTILTFGQSTGSPVSITQTGVPGNLIQIGTFAAFAPVTIDEIKANVSTPINAFLLLLANSNGPATETGGEILQSYNGAFRITANANGSGTDFLDGTFMDAEFSGIAGGFFATLSDSQPPNMLTFGSDVIAQLDTPRAFSFSFTNLSSPLAINASGQLEPNGANVAGTFSAAPLPGALPLFASGLVGFWGWTRRRKKTTAKLAA